MADKNMGITVTGDIGDVTEVLNTLIDLINNIPDQIIDISTNIDTSGIDKLETDLEGIPDQIINVTPSIDEEGITKLESDLAAIPDQIVNIEVNVDESVITQLEADLAAIPDQEVNINVNTDGVDKAEGDLSGLADSEEAVGAGGAVASAGLVAGVGLMIDGAGNYKDSMSRIGTAQDGLFETTQQISDKWGATMSQMSDATGRSGGQIRKDIADMGIVGVHSVSTITEGFGLMSGAAFNAGVDIGTVETAYTKVVSTGMLSGKQLKALGIDSDEVFKRTGMSMDEVKAKMLGMTREERAAFLNLLMDSDKNRAGIEAYKASWEHLKETAGRALEYIGRILGATLLPVATVVIGTVVGLLSTLADMIDGLDGPIGFVVKGIIGIGLAAGLIIGAVVALGAAWDLLNISQGIATAKMIWHTALALPARIAMLSNAYAAGGLSGAYDALTGKTVFNSEVTAINTGAQNDGIIARVRLGAEQVLLTARSWLGTAATTAQTAAERLYAFATGGSVLATTGAVATRIALALWSGIAAVASGALTAATWLLNIAMDANPIMLVVLAIAALVAGLIWAYYNIKPVKDAIDYLWKGIKAFWDAVTSLNPDKLWEWMWKGLQALWDLVTLPMKLIQNFILTIWNWLSGKGGGTSGQALTTITWDWLWKGIQAAIDLVTLPMRVLQKFILDIWNWLKSLAWKALWDWLWKGLMDAINLVTAPMRILQQFILDIWNWLTSLDPKAIWNWLWAEFGNVVNWLYSKWDEFNKYIASVYNWFISIPNKIWEWVWSNLKAVLDWVMDKWDKFTKWLKVVYDGIVNLPSDIWGWLWATIQAAIDKVKKPIQDFIDWLTGKGKSDVQTGGEDWGKALGDGIQKAIPYIQARLDPIGSMLKMHSPPKEGPLSEITFESWRDFGVGLLTSLASGISGGNSLVNKALEKILPSSASLNPGDLSLSGNAMNAIATPSKEGKGDVKQEFNLTFKIDNINAANKAEANEAADNIVKAVLQKLKTELPGKSITPYNVGEYYG